MKRADLVVTGGPSLHAARRELHGNVNRLPNAVDVEHFAPSRLQAGNPHFLAAQPGLGSAPAALCHERFDPVHQPGREAGDGVDAVMGAQRQQRARLAAIGTGQAGL
jgi:hypothetical protein